MLTILIGRNRGVSRSPDRMGRYRLVSMGRTIAYNMVKALN